MRAKVYIDGYNFYYGYLKGHPERKWLYLALDHQLPDTIPVGTHGNFIRRPEAWR